MDKAYVERIIPDYKQIVNTLQRDVPGGAPVHYT